MTARENLMDDLLCLYAPYRALERIDAFAHELAEEIRDAFERSEVSRLMMAHNDGVLDAADLIDPEVNDA